MAAAVAVYFAIGIAFAAWAYRMDRGHPHRLRGVLLFVPFWSLVWSVFLLERGVSWLSDPKPFTLFGSIIVLALLLAVIGLGMFFVVVGSWFVAVETLGVAAISSLHLVPRLRLRGTSDRAAR